MIRRFFNWVFFRRFETAGREYDYQANVMVVIDNNRHARELVVTVGIPGDALDEYVTMVNVLAEVLNEGAANGRTSIRDFAWRLHISRALQHITKFFAALKDDDEPHLDHAFCRLGLAVAAKRKVDAAEKVVVKSEAQSIRRNCLGP